MSLLLNIKAIIMRKTAALLFISCLAVLSLNAQKISGEGDIVQQEIQLESFTGVGLGFSGDIYITQGSPQKVVVHAQQNIIDNIKRNVKGGTWHVNFEKNVRNHKPVKVYITIPELRDASVSGSGSLETTGQFTGLGDLHTAVAGSGDIKLDVEAGDVQSAVSGSGTIKMSGRAKSLEAAISGSGDIMAMDMRVEDCSVAISGSGDIEVHATGNLEVAISGSGDVKYAGEPDKVKSRVSGSGDVTQVNR